MNCPLQNQRLIQLYSQNNTSNPSHVDHTAEEEACDLQRYLQVPSQQHLQQPEETQHYGQQYDEKNDYSFQLSELRDKLISIEQISQGEITRLKKELQIQREKTMKETVSVGVNTEPDHRDTEIALLRQMLKQQSLVNRQLLQETLRHHQDTPFHNIPSTKYPPIRVTKN